MALITCPECNCMNVSDTSDNCPKCGFPIKRHNELQKELQRRLELIDNAPYPKRPKFFSINKYAYSIFITLPMMIVFLFTGSPAFSLVMLSFSIVLFYTSFKNYKRMLKINKEETEDWENTKVKRKQELIEQYKNMDETDKQNAISSIRARRPSKPKCPTCGSEEVHLISVEEKAIGFAIVGVFSSNMGKTMECENCGYKW